MQNQNQKLELKNSGKMQLAQLEHLPSLERALFLSLPQETQEQLCELPLPEARLWFLLMMEAARARYAMPEIEMLLMVDSLKSFPLEIVQRAFEHIRLNPPEGYKGMPSESEVIAAVNLLRSQDFAEAQRKRDAEYNEEMRQLKYRRDVLGEKFYGIEDLMQDFREKYGHELDDHFAMEPVTPVVKQETESEETARLEARRQEMLADLRRVHPELGVNHE